jgi:hypothetical protein
MADSADTADTAAMAATAAMEVSVTDDTLDTVSEDTATDSATEDLVYTADKHPINQYIPVGSLQTCFVNFLTSFEHDFV